MQAGRLRSQGGAHLVFRTDPRDSVQMWSEVSSL